MTPETLQNYTDVELPKYEVWKKTNNLQSWVNYDWNGAIGKVIKITFDPAGSKYRVYVYRLSGSSKYNPYFNPAMATGSSGGYENIHERDMTQIDLSKDDELKKVEKAWQKGWKYSYSSTQGPRWENLLSTVGGKRSKSTKRTKSAKRVKTAKRSKSRRTRRERK
jgi:hypothetical protein